jgi:hypothetical protein
MSPGSSERGFQLLLNELDCAEAMAGLANFSIDFENFCRTYNNARQHYESVVAQLLQLHLPPERILEIHRRLSHLNIWLSVLGPAQNMEM